MKYQNETLVPKQTKFIMKDQNMVKWTKFIKQNQYEALETKGNMKDQNEVLQRKMRQNAANYFWKPQTMHYLPEWEKADQICNEKPK